MSTAICIPEDCHQTLLYDDFNEVITPFLRVACIDRNGKATTKDYSINGDDYNVLGNVLTEPGDGSSCCHSVMLYEQLGSCVASPFIRQYTQGAGGALEVSNYTLDGAPLVPAGTIVSAPPAMTLTNREMCDVARHETFLRWYESCGSAVRSTYDTDINGASYTPGDAVYAGNCLCGSVFVKREMCDTLSDQTIVKFIRLSKFDETGTELSWIDTDLNGLGYVPSGTVGKCEIELPEAEFTVERQLCRKYFALYKVPLSEATNAGPYVWEFPRPAPSTGNFTVSVDKGKWEPYGYSLTNASKTTFTFSDELYLLDFDLYCAPSEDASELAVSNNIEFTAKTVTYEGIQGDGPMNWVEATRSVHLKSLSELAANPSESLSWQSMDDAYVQYGTYLRGMLQFKANNSTEISFTTNNLGVPGATINRLQLWYFQYVPFLRKTTYNSAGVELGYEDTTLAGDPISPVSNAMICP